MSMHSSLKKKQQKLNKHHWVSFHQLNRRARHMIPQTFIQQKDLTNKFLFAFLTLKNNVTEFVKNKEIIWHGFNYAKTKISSVFTYFLLIFSLSLSIYMHISQIYFPTMVYYNLKIVISYWTMVIHCKHLKPTGILICSIRTYLDILLYFLIFKLLHSFTTISNSTINIKIYIILPFFWK